MLPGCVQGSSHRMKCICVHEQPCLPAGRHNNQNRYGHRPITKQLFMKIKKQQPQPINLDKGTYVRTALPSDANHQLPAQHSFKIPGWAAYKFYKTPISDDAGLLRFNSNSFNFGGLLAERLNVSGWLFYKCCFLPKFPPRFCLIRFVIFRS